MIEFKSPLIMTEAEVAEESARRDQEDAARELRRIKLNQERERERKAEAKRKADEEAGLPPLPGESEQAFFSGFKYGVALCEDGAGERFFVVVRERENVRTFHRLTRPRAQGYSYESWSHAPTDKWEHGIVKADRHSREVAARKVAWSLIEGERRRDEHLADRAQRNLISILECTLGGVME